MMWRYVAVPFYIGIPVEMLGDIVVVVKHESKRVLPKTSGIGVVFFSERSQLIYQP
jgi:hypothetical protein